MFSRAGVLQRNRTMFTDIKKLGGRVSGHKTRVLVLDVLFQAHFCPILP